MTNTIVRRETLRITLWTLALSVVMQGVFLIINRWSLPVVYGNLLGAFAAVLNFFLMCLTVVRCVELPPEKAAMRVRASQGARLIMLAAFLTVGALVSWFNLIAVIIPLLFPRLIILVYRLTHKDAPQTPTNGDATPESGE